MIVIPAIDLRGGQCVRLYQGDYQAETVYFKDPVKMAKLLRVSNAKILHIVDLDAARGGSPDRAHNRDVIRNIREAVQIPLQVGGGVRSLEDARALFDMGVNRVVVGTAAVRNPDLVPRLIDAFGSCSIVVGIDARDGEVRTDGWQEGSGVRVVDLARQMVARGCERIVYTDIGRDGTLQGPNVEAYRTLCREVGGLKITASGGVSGYQDLVSLMQLPRRVDSVIIGKALYENRFPCQGIWCWNDLLHLDLECISTAQLRADEQAAAAESPAEC